MDSLMVFGMDTRELAAPLGIFFLGLSASRNLGVDRERCFLREELEERLLILDSLSVDIFKLLKYYTSSPIYFLRNEAEWAEVLFRTIVVGFLCLSKAANVINLICKPQLSPQMR